MKKWWYGIKGIEFIWHGTNDDPELKIGSAYINSHDVEDHFWDAYAEDGGDTNNFDAFAEWMRAHADEVRDYAQMVVDMYAESAADMAFEVRQEAIQWT